VIYFDKEAPPLPPNPELTPWPPATAAQAAAGAAAAPGVAERPSQDVFKSVLSDPETRIAILGASFGANHPVFATIDSFPGLPKIAKPIVENVSSVRRRLASPEISKRSREVLSDQLTSQLKTLEALAAGEARKKKADELGAHLQHSDWRGGDGYPGLVFNERPIQIWSENPIFLFVKWSGHLKVVPGHPRKDGLLVLEFWDGLFAPVWFYSDLVCTVLRDRDGVAAISYSHVYGDEANTSAGASAISQLVTGTLSVKEVDKLATSLRHEKHANPVFGAIAAYCYDVTGDLNSIRRMAAYYGQRDQAAPYDIVFMGMIENDGTVARVPNVPKDRRRRERPDWVSERMEAVDVRVAGRCPWLRQGWDFLSSPDDAERPLVNDLDRFRKHLTRSVFTTLDKRGGRELVERWRLQRNL
jgi:hypothetical protein